MSQKYLIKEFEAFGQSVGDAVALMQLVVDRIHMHIPRYNWVGFYLFDQSDPSALVLGPHKGSFTPTVKLTVGKGLCGSAAATGQVVVADNVSEDPRYLAASDMVKSEIAVPLVASDKPVAVLNVESYFMSTFKPAAEREFVQACAQLVASCIQKNGMSNLAVA